MKYNELYENNVKASIGRVLTNTKNCWNTAKKITSIPDDFERAGEINTIKEEIPNINLSDIYLEITTMINGYANADVKAWENSNNVSEGGELARYEEEKGKAKLKTSENKYAKLIVEYEKQKRKDKFKISEDKFKEAGKIIEYIIKKGIDKPNKDYENQKNYIQEDYSDETYNSQDVSIEEYIQAANNDGVKKVEEVTEHEIPKRIDELDKQLEDLKKYIHEKYSNETQILFEELKAEAKYSYDGSMDGYIQAMNNGDVKKVVEILDKLIKEGKRTIIDKEMTIAQCIHTYLENNNYEYYASDLTGLYLSFDESKNSKEYKRVCSATYVCWILNELGYLNVTTENNEKSEQTDSDFTSSNIYSAKDLNAFFEKKENIYFEKVEDISTIKPGDLLYYENEEQGDIEIYAGNDNSDNWLVFSCSSNDWINCKFPTARDNSGEDRKLKKPTTVWRIIETPKTSEEKEK